jgi:hypothetical protein
MKARNEGRGGWSGVSRHLLHDGSTIFVKRQDNHRCRMTRPVSPGPSCRRQDLRMVARYFQDRAPHLVRDRYNLSGGRWLNGSRNVYRCGHRLQGVPTSRVDASKLTPGAVDSQNDRGVVYQTGGSLRTPVCLLDFKDTGAPLLGDQEMPGSERQNGLRRAQMPQDDL